MGAHLLADIFRAVARVRAHVAADLFEALTGALHLVPCCLRSGVGQPAHVLAQVCEIAEHVVGARSESAARRTIPLAPAGGFERLSHGSSPYFGCMQRRTPPP